MARFTLIGIFRTSEAALIASEKLDSTLKLIAEWHDTHPEERKRIWDSWPEIEPIVTPIETAIGQEYGFKWELPILMGEEYEIRVYRNFLILWNKWKTRTGAYPLDRFVNRLGGDVLVEGDYVENVEWGEVIIEINCVAPNEKIAKQIALTFNGASEVNYVELRLQNNYHLQYPKHLQELIPDSIQMIKDMGCKRLSVISIQRRLHDIDINRQE